MLTRRTLFKVGTTALVVGSVNAETGIPAVLAQDSSTPWQEKWVFDHEGQEEDQQQSISTSKLLLRAPRRLKLVGLEDLQSIWEIEFETPIEFVDWVPAYNSSEPPALHVRNTDASHIVNRASGDSISIPPSPQDVKLLVHDDLLFRTLVSRAGSHTTVVSLDTGEIIRDIAGFPYFLESGIAADEWAESRLTFYNDDFSKELWKAEGIDVHRALQFEDRLIVFEGTTRLMCLDIQSGELAWTVALQEGTSLITDAHGYLALEYGNQVYCVDSRTGDTVWEIQLEEYEDIAKWQETSTRMTIRIDLPDVRTLVYSGITGEVLLCEKARSYYDEGRFEYYEVGQALVVIDSDEAVVVREIERPEGAPVTYVESGKVVFTGGPTDYVYDAATGDVQTITREVDNGWDMAYFGLLIAGTNSNRAVIYSLASCERIGEIFMETIYFGEYEDIRYLSDEESLMALDLATDKVLWEVPSVGNYIDTVGDSISLWGVYDGSYVTKLTALSKNGEVLWTYAGDESLGKMLFGEDRCLVVNRSSVYSIDTLTGEAKVQCHLAEGTGRSDLMLCPSGVLMYTGERSVMYGE